MYFTGLIVTGDNTDTQQFQNYKWYAAGCYEDDVRMTLLLHHTQTPGHVVLTLITLIHCNWGKDHSIGLSNFAIGTAMVLVAQSADKGV